MARPGSAPAGDMTVEHVPDVVRRFVQAHLSSIAELEALLLVWSSPDQTWDAGTVSNRLYIGESHARLVLDALHRRGLMLRHGEQFLFRPASDSLRSEVEALAAAYPRLLIPITQLIHARGRGAGPQT